MTQRADKSEEAGALRGMNLLIAEDDWLLADTLAVLSEERGARIVGPFASTSAAIRALDASRIDFALVDMNLQDCFSDGLLDKLRTRQIPFAVLTAYHALPSNSADYAVMTLHKPIDHSRLFALLMQYSGRSRTA